MNSQTTLKLPSVEDMTPDELRSAITKIRRILSDDYRRLNSYDQAIVKNEDIAKVVLGIDPTNDDMKRLFHHKTIEQRKISTPMQELMEQINVLQSTDLNTGLIRTFLALMLNGRVADLYKAFKINFPEYH